MSHNTALPPAGPQIDYHDTANAAYLAACPWSDEETCIEALFRARWPEGYRCPYCRHPEYYIIGTRRLPLYDCKRCRKQLSLTAGTVFHGSSTPLHKWFQAILLHAREEGISAVRLARTIGVTYKTAWLIGHKLRKVMSVEVDKTLLEGEVFVTDFIFYHQKYIHSAEWQPEEQCVLVGGVLDDEDDVVQFKIKQVPRGHAPLRNCAPKIQSFQHDCIAPESLRTMVYMSRHNLERQYPTPWPRPRHEEAEWIKRTDRARRARLKPIIGQAEVWIAWTFCGIGPKHFQVYLDQYSYVQNRWGQEISESFLRECTGIRAVSYPELTGTPSRRIRQLFRLDKPLPQPHTPGSTS